MRIQLPMAIQSRTGFLFHGSLLILLTLAAVAGAADAQKGQAHFPDESGYEYGAASDGFDVPYIPTPMKVVRALLDLGFVGPEDFLIDLGSGDGRIVVTAAKEYGARGFGVDLNKDLVALSKKYAAAAGVENTVDFFVRDIFETDIRSASVVSLYLLDHINIQLRPKLLTELKPGARILSHDFHMGDWHPDETVELSIRHRNQNDTTLYLWIVPAKAAGRWQWRLPLPGQEQFFELELDQSYQDISGEAKSRGYPLPIFDAELKGAQLQFSLFVVGSNPDNRHDYKGRVEGNRIVGTVEIGGAAAKTRLEWQAVKVR